MFSLSDFRKLIDTLASDVNMNFRDFFSLTVKQELDGSKM